MFWVCKKCEFREFLHIEHCSRCGTGAPPKLVAHDPDPRKKFVRHNTAPKPAPPARPDAGSGGYY